MAGKKSDQIKIYVVIGLSLVLITGAYFQFIHAKIRSGKDVAASTASTAPLAQLKVPLINKEKSGNKRSGGSSVDQDQYLPTSIRDIFSPLESSPDKESRPKEQEEEVSSFTLKGTIVGGERPIAIINDKFVRTGDWIGEYKVTRIGKKEVLLDSDGEKMVLEIMKNE